MGTSIEEIEAQEWFYEQLKKLVTAIQEFESIWHPDGQLWNTGRRRFRFEGACYEIVISTDESTAEVKP